VEDLNAYEAMLRCHGLSRELSQENHNKAYRAVRRAIEIDSNDPVAWARLGELYCHAHAYRYLEIDDALGEAERAACKAGRLDPNCQRAHFATAYVHTLRKNHPGAMIACDRILELNPNAAFMIGMAAVWLGVASRFERALPLLDKSIELNPSYPGFFHFLPFLHAFSERDYERALQSAQRFNLPAWFWDPLVRAATLGRLGRETEAAAAYQQLVSLRPDFPERPRRYIECLIHAEDDVQHILDGLRVAGLES
jgi:tetratricopeptide (TPR) repeat protein